MAFQGARSRPNDSMIRTLFRSLVGALSPPAAPPDATTQRTSAASSRWSKAGFARGAPVFIGPTIPPRAAASSSLITGRAPRISSNWRWQPGNTSRPKAPRPAVLRPGRRAALQTGSCLCSSLRKTARHARRRGAVGSRAGGAPINRSDQTIRSRTGSHFTFVSRRYDSTDITSATASSKARSTPQRGVSRLRIQSKKFCMCEVTFISPCRYA